MIEEKFRHVAEYALNSIELIKKSGLQVIEMRDRYVKMLLPKEGNINHVGMLYAGSLFIIGEFTGGIIHGASFDYSRFYPIVKEVSIRFLKPAMTDVTLAVELGEEQASSIQTDAEKNGKADFTLDLEIKDANGVVVAVVKGTWQIRTVPNELKELFALKA